VRSGGPWESRIPFSGLEGVIEEFVERARSSFAPVAAIVQCSCIMASRSHSPCSHTMTLTSTGGYTSIFKDGKLKPGLYKIQNIVSQTYVDIQEHTRELCCRPAAVIEGNGLVSLHLHLAHIVVVVMIFSGKSTLWVLDIAYTRHSREFYSVRLR